MNNDYYNFSVNPNKCLTTYTNNTVSTWDCVLDHPAQSWNLASDGTLRHNQSDNPNKCISIDSNNKLVLTPCDSKTLPPAKFTYNDKNHLVINNFLNNNQCVTRNFSDTRDGVPPQIVECNDQSPATDMMQTFNKRSTTQQFRIKNDKSVRNKYAVPALNYKNSDGSIYDGDLYITYDPTATVDTRIITLKPLNNNTTQLWKQSIDNKICSVYDPTKCISRNADQIILTDLTKALPITIGNYKNDLSFPKTSNFKFSDGKCLNIDGGDYTKGIINTYTCTGARSDTVAFVQEPLRTPIVAPTPVVSQTSTVVPTTKVVPTTTVTPQISNIQIPLDPIKYKNPNLGDCNTILPSDFYEKYKYTTVDNYNKLIDDLIKDPKKCYLPLTNEQIQNEWKTRSDCTNIPTIDPYTTIKRIDDYIDTYQKDPKKCYKPLTDVEIQNEWKTRSDCTNIPTIDPYTTIKRIDNYIDDYKKFPENCYNPLDPNIYNKTNWADCTNIPKYDEIKYMPETKYNQMLSTYASNPQICYKPIDKTTYDSLWKSNSDCTNILDYETNKYTSNSKLIEGINKYKSDSKMCYKPIEYNEFQKIWSDLGMSGDAPTKYNKYTTKEKLQESIKKLIAQIPKSDTPTFTSGNMTIKDENITLDTIDTNTFQNLWANAGCSVSMPTIDDIINNKKIRETPINDIIKYINDISITNDDNKRKLCYGNDSTKYPVNTNEELNALWKQAGCITDTKLTDKQLKMSRSDVINDINKTASSILMADRKNCYGADETKWPDNNGNNNIITRQQWENIWKNNGHCTTIPTYDDSIRKLTKEQAIKKANELGLSEKDEDRQSCYDSDSKKWPMNQTDFNTAWKKAGCTTSPANNYLTTDKATTYINTVSNSTIKEDNIACYGTDESTWPMNKRNWTWIIVIIVIVLIIMIIVGIYVFKRISASKTQNMQGGSIFNTILFSESL